jgi:hypothetical protein
MKDTKLDGSTIPRIVAGPLHVAQSGDPSGNGELIRYHRDRSVRMIKSEQSEPDANPARISRYPFEESME